jgi:hypothetical protein
MRVAEALVINRSLVRWRRGRQDLTGEVQHWLRENVGQRNVAWEYVGREDALTGVLTPEIRFAETGKAAHFKLRWL